MYYFKQIALVIISLAISSCGGEGTGKVGVETDGSGFITINPEEAIAAGTVSINDLAHDIRLVSLETRDESLIRNFSGYAGSRYIISVENSKMLLFDAGGGFLAEIARRGSGPGEYGQIDSWAVDEAETTLLFHDRGKDYIEVYDIDARMRRNSFPVMGKGGLDEFVILGDSVLAVLPDQFSGTGWLWFYQNSRGEITGGIRNQPLEHPGAWAGGSAVFVRTNSKAIAFQPVDSDTLWLIENRIMKPVLKFLLPRPSVAGDEETGSDCRVQYIDDRLLVFSRAWYQKTVSPGNASISIDDISGYVLFREEKTLRRVKNYTVTIEGIEMTLEYVAFRSGGMIYSTVQSPAFLNMVTDELVKTELTGSQREYWNKMLTSVTESDNPLIIKAKLK